MDSLFCSEAGLFYGLHPEKAEGDVVDTETAEPVEETEEKQAENEAGTEEEKVSTETEESGQDFPGK